LQRAVEIVEADQLDALPGIGIRRARIAPFDLLLRDAAQLRAIVLVVLVVQIARHRRAREHRRSQSERQEALTKPHRLFSPKDVALLRLPSPELPGGCVATI